MGDVPRRLIVIEAAIPTGDECTGCEHLAGDIWCADGSIPDNGDTTPGLRLPACRARDGFTVYPPGSAVPELVAAARRYAAADAAYESAVEEHGTEHENTIAAGERRWQAGHAMDDAARKVAKETP